MAETIQGFYNRRHPEKTDYYRIIEASFEEFERSYPELFEEKYGYLRSNAEFIVMRSPLLTGPANLSCCRFFSMHKRARW